MPTQTKSQPNHMYLLHTQQDIDAHKRLVLVDWLIEVVDEFALSQESLYLAISLLDRFLSLHAVQRCQLQLLGVTCLWVASKYEEVLPPALQVRASSKKVG
jgi:cyclin A